MQIIAVGIDLIETARIARQLRAGNKRFLARVFTRAEAAYCLSMARPAQHLAARFAAKEAVMKALRTGWAKGVGWTQIEIRRGKDGAPALRLAGAAAKRAKALRIRKWLVSLTHAEGIAAAITIGVGRR